MSTHAKIILSLALVTFIPMGCSSTEEAAPTNVRPVNPGTDGGGGDAGPNGCAGPGDCVKTEPKNLTDFLNACTDGECAPFDNAARLPLYKPCEALPPIP